MNQSDLPTIRLLAGNGAFSISRHAYNRMLERDISIDDVEGILTSPTNQIVECQPPSTTPGKEHDDERVLLYDPCGPKYSIIVLAVLFTSTPDLRIVTVENVNEGKWERREGVPCLVRK